ncbi:MAG: hypothetical protein WCX95_01625 [Candidatus Gracilibacteria bacterium]
MPEEESPNCNPDAPKKEKSFIGKIFDSKFFDWTNIGKEDVKRKNCDERREYQDLVRTEKVEVFLPAEGKFLEIKGVTSEKLLAAKSAIDIALGYIKSDKKISDFFDKYGIKIQPTSYYLAIAVKESLLNPTANTGANNPDFTDWAVGYFQVKQVALREVNYNFNTLFSKDSVYSGEPLNSDDQMMASPNNCVAGILYWHLGEKFYLKDMPNKFPKEDHDKFVAMIYFLGTNQFKSLYLSLGEPKSFKEFAEGIALHLSKNFNFIAVQNGGLTTNYNPSFGVETRSYTNTGSLDAGDINEKLHKKYILIKGKKFNAESLFEAIRYAEITSGLMNDPDLKAPETLLYKVKKGETFSAIIKGLLPLYNLEITDPNIETKVVNAIVYMANPGGKYDHLKIDSEIKVPSRNAVYKTLSAAGIIHVIKKGEKMASIAEVIGKRFGIINLTKTRIYKLSDFLISYNKRVNKAYSRKLMPETPVYIPEKTEIEIALK